jgi:deoxyribodipyrimidine photo-lyase
MGVAVVLINRCLRVRDHPALAAAARSADAVVPLVVYDQVLLRSAFATPNRLGFLHEALDDLRANLRARGADLVVRRGDPAQEAVEAAHRVGAGTIFTTDDVSRHARRRQERLAKLAAGRGIGVERSPGVGVVEGGTLRPAGGDHFKVFTPFHRAWSRAAWRPVEPAPRRLRLPEGVEVGELLEPPDRAGQSPRRAKGGESAGRRLLRRWSTGEGPARYPERHDDVAQDATSRLSPYLHFGCLSPLEVAGDLAEGPDGGAFTRQLCWRDFYHQVAAAFPDLPRADYRSRGDRWRRGDRADELFAAWADGRTGYPLVDAGMRQLRAEGWMHNRARLVTASFLVKDLRIDWRRGAGHFLRWLVDGDIVQNSANWQWTAGTGNDTRPNRVLNPERQAERFDPDGAYIRRHVPELAGLEAPTVRRPWTLGPDRLRALGYPLPVVDHGAAAAAFRAGRTRSPPDRLPGLG